ncbi:MAG: excisionase family DNA-binding protein [Bryobacterales bacterium]|nr:excisionase family DNA-binding protein [Bryobacterales bacterium]
MARSSGRLLLAYANRQHPLTLRVGEDGEGMGPPIQLPPSAVALLLEILQEMAAGRGLTLIPENAELTTVQAAQLLNVSRPFLIKLLDDRVLPHRKVGKHRRLRLEDVMDYKSRIDRDREKILDQLAREAQEQGLGYET